MSSVKAKEENKEKMYQLLDSIENMKRELKYLKRKKLKHYSYIDEEESLKRKIKKLVKDYNLDEEVLKSVINPKDEMKAYDYNLDKEALKSLSLINSKNESKPLETIDWASNRDYYYNLDEEVLKSVINSKDEMKALDFEKYNGHAPDLILISPNILLTNSITIDLSCLTSISKYPYDIKKAKNGVFPGEKGDDGEPGLHGFNGGRLIILTKKNLNLTNLDFKSSGGKGGPGQDGI